MTSEERRRRSWVPAAVLLGVLVLGYLALRAAESPLAPWIAERISKELGAACFVDGLRVLGPRRVRLDGLSCRWVDGPLAGVDLAAIELSLTAFPREGALPPLQEVRIRSGQVQLRHVELPGTRETAPAEASPPPPVAAADQAETEAEAPLPDPATLPPSRIERAAERFLDLSRELDGEPKVAATLRRVLRRFGDQGQLRVEGLRVTEEGQLRVRDLRAELHRVGAGGNATLAVLLEGGGVAAAEMTLGERSIEQSRVQLENVPLRTPLDRMESLDVIQGGLVTGELRVEPGPTWTLAVEVRDLKVQHEFLGQEPVTIVSLGGRGTLLPEAGLGSLRLGEATWRLGDAGGPLSLDLNEVGSDRGAQLRLVIGGKKMAPGAALLALPEQVLPRSWAAEVQGALDFEIRFDGPARLRQAWNLDWDWDFSQLSLAEGDLAARVREMAGSFRHQFPAARPGEPRPERIVGPEDPHFVPLSGISTWLQTAVVTTEDAGFWGHRGFEPTELKEAVLENLRSGEGRGGSTITQQLAKNLFLSGARTASRKLQEALVASRLEEELPKSRLLELYLNIAEWGPGLYGARDAAEHYLGRSPSTLQPEEAAFLASLLPSPVRFHGYYHRGGLTENRRERVTEILATMLALGRMTPDEHVRATAAPLELALCPW